MSNIIYTTNQCSFDEFFRQLMLECVKQVPQDSQCYYIWANPLSNLKTLIEKLECSNNMLLFIPDDLSDFNFQPKDKITWGAKIISDKVKSCPDKKFTLITDVHYLNREFNNIKNLSIIETDLITMEKSLYQKVDPVISKDFSNNSNYVVLGNRASSSRITIFSYLLGLGIEQQGILRVSELIKEKISNFDSYLDLVPWHINDQSLVPILESGYQKLKLYQNSIDFKDNHDNNYRHDIHSRNYTENIRQFYRSTTVEICTETYYEEPSHMLTEKTLNMILGCNFPILLCGRDSVKHLESLGFDVFRDIVDHDYDSVDDPMQRLRLAVDLNKDLLTGQTLTQEKWLANKQRFVKNVEHAKQGMYDVIRERVLKKFQSIIAN